MRKVGIVIGILLALFWVAAGAYLGFIGVEDHGRELRNPIFFVLGLVMALLTLWRLYRTVIR